MKWMTALLLAMSSAMLGASDLGAQVARNLTGNWQLDAQTDPASVSGASAALVKTAYTGNLVLTHDGSYTFTGTWTMDGQTGTLSSGSISDIYVGLMVSGYKLGATMPTTSFYFNGSLNAALDTITGTFNGFAQDGTRWDGLFNLRFWPAVVNFPPTISVIPDPTGKSFIVGDTVDIVIAAPDPNPDVVTLLPSAMPPGLSFTSSPGNPAVGRITGTLTEAGTFPVSITAIDSGFPVLTAVASIQFVVCKVVAEAPECLEILRGLTGTPQRRCPGRAGVTLIGADPTPHSVRVEIEDTRIVKFADSPGPSVVVSHATCPGEYYLALEPANPGKTRVTVELDGRLVLDSRAGVVAYQPEIKFAPPSVFGSLESTKQNHADLTFRGPIEPNADNPPFFMTSYSADLLLEALGVSTLEFYGRTSFKATITIVPDPLSDPHCLARLHDVPVTISATQSAASGWAFIGGRLAEAGSFVSFESTSSSSLGKSPLLSVPFVAPLNAKHPLGDLHQWETPGRFGPFTTGAGGAGKGFVEWSDKLMLNDPRELSTAWRIVLHRVKPPQLSPKAAGWCKATLGLIDGLYLGVVLRCPEHP